VSRIRYERTLDEIDPFLGCRCIIRIDHTTWMSTDSVTRSVTGLGIRIRGCLVATQTGVDLSGEIR
jgi:hypothetical protein